MKKISLDDRLLEQSIRNMLSTLCFSGMNEVWIRLDEQNQTASFEFARANLSSKEVFDETLAIQDTEPERQPEPKPAETKTDSVVATKDSAESSSEEGQLDYKGFVALVEQDDGSKETQSKIVAYFAYASLDSLLRLNNEFSLGLDTDKTVDELRVEIASCFQ